MATLIEITDAMRHQGDLATPHTWPTKVAHWLAAALVLYASVENGKVVDALYDPYAMRIETLAGVAIAVLYTYLWFWVRGAGGGSRLPLEAPAWERRLASSVHIGIYLTIAAALLSGFAMAYLVQTDVVGVKATRLILQMSPRFAFIRGFHEVSARILLGLFLLHLAGALWHRLIRRDYVMQSISLLTGKPAA